MANGQELYTRAGEQESLQNRPPSPGRSRVSLEKRPASLGRTIHRAAQTDISAPPGVQTLSGVTSKHIEMSISPVGGANSAESSLISDVHGAPGGGDAALDTSIASLGEHFAADNGIYSMNGRQHQENSFEMDVDSPKQEFFSNAESGLPHADFALLKYPKIKPKVMMLPETLAPESGAGLGSPRSQEMHCVMRQVSARVAAELNGLNSVWGPRTKAGDGHLTAEGVVLKLLRQYALNALQEGCKVAFLGESTKVAYRESLPASKDEEELKKQIVELEDELGAIDASCAQWRRLEEGVPTIRDLAEDLQGYDAALTGSDVSENGFADRIAQTGAQLALIERSINEHGAELELLREAKMTFDENMKRSAPRPPSGINILAKLTF